LVSPGFSRSVGKGDRERSVVITARCRQAMEDYLSARTDPSPALFIGFHRPTQARQPRDNRLSAGARYVCRQIARRLSLQRFSPHVLRHTLGTLLQEEMGDARLTAEVLGHSGLGAVAGYTKVAATHLREGCRSGRDPPARGVSEDGGQGAVGQDRSPGLRGGTVLAPTSTAPAPHPGRNERLRLRTGLLR